MSTVASYGLAILGFTMMAMAVARTFGAGLKYIYTRPLIINALRANANYAEQLCKGSPNSYFSAIEAALKTGAMMRSRDPAITVKATLPAYDAQGAMVSMYWKQLLGKVKLAAMAAGGAIVVGMSKGAPPIFVIVLAAGVGGGALWLYLYKEEVDRSIMRARAEILPEVDAAFAGGRYVFPPLPPT
jgi:uncharacterized membrane protein